MATIHQLLTDPPEQGHLALVYEKNEQLDSAISIYINEGLARGQFCVYATIHSRDEGHIDKFSKMILNYKENVEQGNLLVVDLAPFYISALIGDLKPFEEAGKLFADKAKDREDKRVRFVGDGTGFLFKNRHFDSCTMVERWWQEKPFEGSIVCPYSKQFLNTFPHDMHFKEAVISTHDRSLDLSRPSSADTGNQSDVKQLPIAKKIDDSNINKTNRKGETI